MIARKPYTRSGKSKDKEGDRTLEKIRTSPPKSKKQVRPNIMGKIPKRKERDLSPTQLVVIGTQKRLESSNSKTKSKDKEYSHSLSRKSHEDMLKGNEKYKLPIIGKDIEKKMLEAVKKAQEGKFSQGKKQLEKLLKGYSKYKVINYYLGKIHQNQGFSDEARLYFKAYVAKAKEAGSQDVSPSKVAESYYYLRMYSQSVDACNWGIKKEKSSELYSLKGRAQLAEQNYGPALDSFTNAIGLNPSNLQNYEYLGDCYRNLSVFEMAIKSYMKVIVACKVQSIELLSKILICHQKLGNAEKAQFIRLKLETSRARRGYGGQLQKLTIPKWEKGQKTPSSSSEAILIDSCNSIPLSENILDILVNPPPVLALQEAESNISEGNLEASLGIVDRLIPPKCGLGHLKALQIRAFIKYKMQKFDECQEDIAEAARILNKPEVQVFQDLSDKKILENLKFLTNQLKELQAYNLTESQDRHIIERRKKCLREALDALNHKSPADSIISSHLNIIMEKSQISNCALEADINSVFLLRSYRRIIKNWADYSFSLESLEETTDLAFTMVKTKAKQFSVLPLHIIYYFLRPQNHLRSFKEVNEEISVVLGNMCKKYPPNDKCMSQSMIKSFEIEPIKKPKMNLFKNHTRFRSYKELHKAIQGIAKKAERQIEKMRKICSDICLFKCGGKQFKIGLKLAKNEEQNILQERVLCRIVQKMLTKEIKSKADMFYHNIKMVQTKTIGDYLQDVRIQWENTIDSILKEKAGANEPVECFVYDLMRAKCMFSSVKEIQKTVKEFLILDSKGQIEILEMDNRLGFKTRDVVLKIRVNDVVGELQLAIEFESFQNQFNHGLYELFRSPFGCFFASAMWFSGFALSKNKLFFKERMKWKLSRLPRLRKFIYEDQMSLKLTTLNGEMVKLKINNFEVTSISLTCHFLNQKGEFYCINENSQKLVLQKIQPDYKFLIEILEGSFVVEEDQGLPCRIRLENQSRFVSVKNGGLEVMTLEDSQRAETTTVFVKEFFKDYSELIEQCRKKEKMVVSKIIS